MNEALILALSCLAGGGLGAIFFGGLWWTVRRGSSSPRPQLWFLGSMLLRTSIVLAGFYFVGRGHWQRLLLCLAGFVIGRLVIMKQTRISGDVPNRPKREASRAP
jgi:F1F0 ATPase subunit 2